MAENTSLRAKVTDMRIGDSITIPVTAHSYTTIRSYASDLGFALNRRYKTKRNRVQRTYTITRVG